MSRQTNVQKNGKTGQPQIDLAIGIAAVVSYQRNIERKSLKEVSANLGGLPISTILQITRKAASNAVNNGGLPYESANLKADARSGRPKTYLKSLVPSTSKKTHSLHTKTIIGTGSSSSKSSAQEEKDSINFSNYTEKPKTKPASKAKAKAKPGPKLNTAPKAKTAPKA